MKKTNEILVNRTYSPQDIMTILGVGETSVYSFLKSQENNGSFRVLKIGKQYRVERTSFEKWFTNQTAVND